MEYLVVIIVAGLVVLIAWQQISAKRHVHQIEGRVAPGMDDFLDADSRLYGRMVIYFYSPRCTVCRSMKTIIASIEARYPNFIKVDISVSPEIAERFSVASPPVFVQIHNGMIIKVLDGARSEKRIETLLFE